MEGQDEIWPPPPMLPENPTDDLGIVPFRRGYWRVQGSLSDFVKGTIELKSDGILISGKVRVRQEIQIPILICCFLALTCAPCLFIIIGGLFEELFLKNSVRLVPWEDVETLVFDSSQQVVCIVYRVPNYQGVTKTHSLAFFLQAAPFQNFLDHTMRLVEERIVMQRVKASISFAVIALILWLVAVVVFVVVSSARR